MRSTKLWAYTLALREEFPEAKELRIRRAQKADRVVWQLIGRHKGKTVARQIAATSEAAVFQGARDLLVQLNSGTKSRAMPVGALKRHERAAIDLISGRGYRDATERQKVNNVKSVSSWLADRSYPLEQETIERAVLEIAPENNRKRRSTIEGALLLCKVAGLKLNTEPFKYKEPLTRRREAVDDQDIFRRLDEHLPKIEYPGAIWVFRVVGVLGIRGNGCLSLKIPDVFMSEDYPSNGFQPGVKLTYFDSKRKRPAFCTPTIRDWWDHWNLDQVPPELKEYWMPYDTPATNEQIDKANRLLSFYSMQLRRKVNPKASESLGFRALRHAATARLLKSGMQPMLVADLLSTSLQQIEKTYSSYYRQHAITEAERLL